MGLYFATIYGHYIWTLCISPSAQGCTQMSSTAFRRKRDWFEVVKKHIKSVNAFVIAGPTPRFHGCFLIFV